MIRDNFKGTHESRGALLNLVKMIAFSFRGLPTCETKGQDDDLILFGGLKS